MTGRMWLAASRGRSLGDDCASIFAESFLDLLLRLPDGTADAEVIAPRQDALLGDLIRETARDTDRSRHLFYAVAHVPADRRRNLLGTYLALKPPVDEFGALTLEPTDLGMERKRGAYPREPTGSFFASLVPLCNRPALLPPQAKLEEGLRKFDQEIARGTGTPSASSATAREPAAHLR